MTTIADPETTSHSPDPLSANVRKRSSLITSIAVSALVVFFPRWIGRYVLRVPLWHAALIAVVNFAFLWPRLMRLATYPNMEDLLLFPRVALVGAALGYFIALFFVVLPFIPRPGANAACVRHVIRAVLLSTMWVYVWLGALWAFQRITILTALRWGPWYSDQVDLLIGITALISALVLVMIWSVIRAANRDYRLTADLPQPRPPRCDRCGYDLRAADPAGLCPECGKPVAESLVLSRAPTDWEQNPRWFRWRVIARQTATLFRRPQAFFRSVPALSAHDAAHRWLALSAFLIAIFSTWTLFGIRVALLAVPWANHHVKPVDAEVLALDGWEFYAMALANSAAWTFLGLMMVGIETAGVATFSYLRRRPVDLATASKVTSYASTLLLFWVFLGGLQICAYLLYYYAVSVPHAIPARWDSLITSGSLTVAQVGGLLWFEITVYRGMAAVENANK